MELEKKEVGDLCQRRCSVIVKQKDIGSFSKLKKETSEKEKKSKKKERENERAREILR